MQQTCQTMILPSFMTLLTRCLQVFHNLKTIQTDCQPTLDTLTWKICKVDRNISHIMTLYSLSVAFVPLFCYEKCHFQALFVIKSRITVGFVVGAQAVFVQTICATHTLGNIITGKLQMNTSQMTGFRTVYIKGCFDFAEDLIEISCFNIVSGGIGIAVHGIAAPNNGVAVLLYSTNKCREVFWNLFVAHAGNEYDFTCFMAWIQRIQQGQQVVKIKWRAYLNTYGVLYTF